VIKIADSMGFFRFRRSIKILPGVRWNIGKKSTSLSVGPRGAHITMGTAGTRTSVGIPGTGLSYINVSKAHSHVTHSAPGTANIPVPSSSWVASQHGSATIHFPDRLPDEPPIRPDQLSELHSIGSLGEFDVHSLGETQAESVIAQVKEAKKEYSKTVLKKYYADHGHAVSDAFIDHAYDHPGEAFPSKKKGLGCGGILLCVALGWILLKAIENWPK
jgi:hypothetical protein